MRRSQATIEYLILLTLLILGIVVILAKPDNPLKEGLENYFNATGESIENAADSFTF